jgi:hypothetical protein
MRHISDLFQIGCGILMGIAIMYAAFYFQTIWLWVITSVSCVREPGITFGTGGTSEDQTYLQMPVAR